MTKTSITKMILGAVSGLLLTSVATFAQTAAPAPAPAAAPTATPPAVTSTPAPAAAASTPAAAPTPTIAGPKVAIPGGVFYKGLGPQQYAARDKLIGANVVNKDGVVIGDIKDLIMNTSNEVEGVLIGTGGILGAGEKEVGVRYNALVFTKKDGKTVISLPQATKEVIAALEPYGRGAKKSLIEKAQDKLKALSDKTKEGAGPALEKAKEATKGAVDKAKELGKSAVDKTKEVVETAKDKAAPKQ
jgi:sporulation protein YlmC with PRC-barrel domain